MCAPSGTVVARPRACRRRHAASARVETGPTQTSSSPKRLEPVVEGARARRRRRARRRAPPGRRRTAAPRARGARGARTAAAKNFGSSAATVSWRPSAVVVDPVAGEPAGQHARAPARRRAGARPGRGPVRHRDDDVAPRAGARALEEGGEHLRHGSERSRREVGDLDRRKAGRRVLEDAGPAEVVEVVAGSRAVLGDVAEARDRAVDGRRAGRRPGRCRGALRRPAGTPRARRRLARTAPARSRVGGGGRRRRTRFRARSAVSHAVAVGRIGSPSGGSTRTTRAPSRVSSRLAYAPGR